MMGANVMEQKAVKYTGFRWLVLIGGMLMTTLSMMTGMTIAPLIGVIAKDLGVDIGTASFGIMGVNMFTTAIGVVIMGYLVDKAGLFKVMLGSMVLLLVTHLLYPVMGHGYAGVVFLRILTALGGAVGLILLGPIVAQWFPENERGTAMGVSAIGMFGVIGGFTLGPAVVEWAGSWQAGLAWISVIIAVGIVYMVCIMIGGRNIQPPNLVAEKKAEHPAYEGSFFKLIARNPAFWLGLAVMAFSNWSNNAFNDLSPGYLAVDPPAGVGYGPQMAGQLSSGGWIGMMAGMIAGGIMIDRVFKGRSGLMVMLGFVFNLIFYNGILLQPIYSQPAILSGWLLVSGFVNPFTAIGNMYFAIKSFSPSVMGKIMASWTFIGNIAGSVGVMAGSYALHATGTYHTSFMIVSVVCILGFVAALVSKDRRTELEMRAEGKLACRNG